MNHIKKTSLLLFVLAIALSCQGCVGRMFYHPDRTVYDTPDRHGLLYGWTAGADNICLDATSSITLPSLSHDDGIFM